MFTKPRPPVKKKILTGRTASRSYVTRGRKNVYWGKFRKGERPITTDITGRTLRAKNFHTPGLGVIPANAIYKQRKRNAGDRPYKDTFNKRYVSSPRINRPWRGDISGHAIRRRKPKTSQQVGEGYAVLSFTRKTRAGKPLPGSGYASRSRSGRTSKAVPGTKPGLGAIGFAMYSFRLRGLKGVKGGGSITGNFNNNGRPLDKKPPGIGGRFLDIFRGNIKAQRSQVGGGSISGRTFNNGGSPIDVKGPGLGARFVDRYQGSIRGQKGFTQNGYGYAGDFKTRRPVHGGGSISGKRWNNNRQPINVKGAGMGARFVASYRGNIRGRKAFGEQGYGYAGSVRTGRPIKGGGSISGQPRNNFFQPIDVRAPGIGALGVSTYRGNLKGVKAFGEPGYGYAGNIKTGRPVKGGGSISGQPRNNFFQPIDVRAPGIGAQGISTYQGTLKGVKAFEQPGYAYSGNIKTGRPVKGGGSVSGKLWNNHNSPIQGKSFLPAALKVSIYSGNIKARRPEKGGGSVSGKLWNNDQKPIMVQIPVTAEARSIGYSGFIRQKLFSKKYIHNPNAKAEALKKERPDKSTYSIGGMAVRTPAKEYERNKLAALGALKGESAGKNSLRALEYSSKIKLVWINVFDKNVKRSGRVPMKKYVHNPNSKKGALMVFAPSRANARIKDLQVNVKMSKPNGKNLHPDAQFAHGYRNNVKQDRTVLMNLKLKWAKLFKKNDTQPRAVKEKIRKPRYDKRERDLWKDLYD